MLQSQNPAGQGADGSLQSGTGYAKVHDTKFVADVEDYTMLRL